MFKSCKCMYEMYVQKFCSLFTFVYIFNIIATSIQILIVNINGAFIYLPYTLLQQIHEHIVGRRTIICIILSFSYNI